jgi:hypothetical protein
MVDFIVRKVGFDLSRLVSVDGPFSIDFWNAQSIELGGQPRRSFEAVREELAFRLDRVVLEFDIEEKIVDIREDPSAIRRLAQLLDIDRDDLEMRLQATHGRTLLGRFVSELRSEGSKQRPQAPGSERDDWDDDQGDSVREEPSVPAPALLVQLLKASVSFTTVGSAWPAQGVLKINEHSFDVDIYARVIGGSARGNPLERRFQNPSQQSPIKDDHDRYELLFGLWTEQGNERAVVVAFDAYRRVGRTTRFSMFMPLSLLEQAADTGFASHENSKGETLYAFRPENIGRYVQTMIDAGLWTTVLTPTATSPRDSQKPARAPAVDPVKRDAKNQLNIRPRVGMYSAFARLNYKPWFALAEFVDNSIQSFLSRRSALVEAGHDGPLVIDINLDDNEITVTDRAGGIAWRDFPRAFSPAAPPDDPSGLSEFGLGMKAAACWFSRRWSVRTSALGEAVERTVAFDIPAISRDGLEELPIETRPARESDHYTVVTMRDLRVHPRGKTLVKIREHIASIYRVLTKDGVVKLRLTAGGTAQELDYVTPTLLEAPYYRTPKGSTRTWRQPFEIDLGDKKVTGWAGIMQKGSHALAGFSVFRRQRLIEGSVGETYKPHLIFGTPNSYAYQRVVGEIFVEGFDVSHTKDGIQWHGQEDEILESIRRQIDSPSCPLLDQADGYRVRKTADSLPASFGAEALSDTAAALSQADVVEAVTDKVSASLAESSTDSSPPVQPVPILQEREFKLQITRDGKPWSIHLELVRDAATSFYSTAIETRDGLEVVTVRLNLDHDFSIAFINDNESALQPMMRFVAALALSERLALQAGVTGARAVRHVANELLRSIVSDRRET